METVDLGVRSSEKIVHIYKCQFSIDNSVVDCSDPISIVEYYELTVAISNLLNDTICSIRISTHILIVYLDGVTVGIPCQGSTST